MPAILPKRREAGIPHAQLSLADELETFELNALPAEVARYLSAVDLYRREGCPPVWRPESLEGVDRGVTR